MVRVITTTPVRLPAIAGAGGGTGKLAAFLLTYSVRKSPDMDPQSSVLSPGQGVLHRLCLAAGEVSASSSLVQ